MAPTPNAGAGRVPPDARDVALQFNEAINGRDLAALTALMTESHRFVDSAGTVLEGRGAAAAAWAGFFERFPDYRNHFETVQSRGLRVVMVGRSVCSVPELHGPAIWTARVEGFRVGEWRVYEDRPETRSALGIE